MDKITSFEQLRVWQKSQDLAVEVYIITKSFPKDELFAITNQIRRAASSISANIAEGFGRKSQKDKEHFYNISYGSLLELKSFLYLSNRLQYISNDDLSKLLESCLSCQKLIIASKKSLNKIEDN